MVCACPIRGVYHLLKVDTRERTGLRRCSGAVDKEAGQGVRWNSEQLAGQLRLTVRVAAMRSASTSVDSLFPSDFPDGGASSGPAWRSAV